MLEPCLLCRGNTWCSLLFISLFVSSGQPLKYVHYKEGESWVASQELCRIKHTDLAYVTTSTQNSKIADLVKSWTGIIGFNNNAWFGLFNDAWMWSDGGQTSFRYWQTGKPNGGSCAAVSVSEQGRWVDINCASKAAFVCQGGERLKCQIHTFVDNVVKYKKTTEIAAILEL